MRTALIILVIFGMAVIAPAQQPFRIDQSVYTVPQTQFQPTDEPKADRSFYRRRSRYDAQFWASTGVYWAGAVTDMVGTQRAIDNGLIEGNPLFRRSDGSARIGLNVAVTAGAYAATVWLHKRNPKAANAIRYLGGAVRLSIGASNISQ